MTELEEQLLQTLSYYESMSLELILIDMDSEFLKAHRELTTQDLELTLVKLKKKKLIKCQFLSGENKWIRIYPKRSIINKLLSHLKFMFK